VSVRWLSCSKDISNPTKGTPETCGVDTGHAEPGFPTAPAMIEDVGLDSSLYNIQPSLPFNTDYNNPSDLASTSFNLYNQEEQHELLAMVYPMKDDFPLGQEPNMLFSMDNDLSTASWGIPYFGNDLFS
jgi:hypothetical protein